MFIVVCLVLFNHCLPSPLFDSSYSMVITDRDGNLLGASIAHDEQWRFPPLKNIPDKFVKSLITFEDQRFMAHPGVDPFAVLRAIRQNFKSGRKASGASTITMQVIRLSRKGRERTYIEKVIEMVMAVRLELSMSKKEILSLFAAHAPFGGNVVGIEAAAWRYFGKYPEQLTWAETTLLAVLPNNPAMVHPGRNRDLLENKRNTLLDRLHQKGIIDALTMKLAKSEKLPVKPVPLPRTAPHLLARLQQLKNTEIKSIHKNNHPDIYRVRTTLNKEIQMHATESIVRHHQYLAGNGIHNAAALIMEVDTGNVAAYVGNIPDFSKADHGNHVDIITSPRSTGSILKPLLYAAMIDSGELIPSELVPDIPTRIGGFAPQNYTRMFQGAVPASMALSRSLNVPAVKMLRSYGVDRFYSLLKRLGMNTLNRPAQDYGLTLILGGAECTLWDITAIYAGLARQVNHHSKKPVLFSPVLYMDSQKKDNTLSGSSTNQSTIFSSGACWLVFEAMLEVVRPGGDSEWKNFSSSKKIAWKTGTSYGHRDAWAIGITPKYVVGVWVGNADGEGRAGLTGLSAAAPILFDLFGLLDAPRKWFDSPEADLVTINVCSKSGFRTGPNCTATRDIVSAKAGFASRSCPYCKIIHCDLTCSHQVHADCERVYDIRPVIFFVLPPTMEWYYKKKHSDYRPIPTYRADCFNSPDIVRTKSLSLIYPGRHGRIYIPIELDGNRGKTVFKAAHRDHAATVFWHLDNTYLGATNEIHQMPVSASPGKHVITLIDENGEEVSRKFQVLAKE